MDVLYFKITKHITYVLCRFSACPLGESWPTFHSSALAGADNKETPIHKWPHRRTPWSPAKNPSFPRQSAIQTISNRTLFAHQNHAKSVWGLATQRLPSPSQPWPICFLPRPGGDMFKRLNTLVVERNQRCLSPFSLHTFIHSSGKGHFAVDFWNPKIWKACLFDRENKAVPPWPWSRSARHARNSWKRQLPVGPKINPILQTAKCTIKWYQM